MRIFSYFISIVGLLMIGLAGVQNGHAQTDDAPVCPQQVFLPTLIRGGAASGSSGGGTRGAYESDLPDFNGDGCADLAIGAPYAGFDGGSRQGQVNVVYGGMHGLTPIGNQTWHLDGGYDENGNSLGDLQGVASDQDLLGEVLATGDFNGDGYTDLAIGVPLENVGSVVNGGAVHVIYGSESGLTADRNEWWTQSGGYRDADGDGSGIFLGDIYGGPEDNDRFGGALTAGNFNGDEYDDLAIGVSYEDIGSVEDAGAFQILYGTSSGLNDAGSQFWDQGDVYEDPEGDGSSVVIGDIVGGVEAYDFVGDTLASGDFNGDGYDDLAVGAFGEDIDDESNAGAVNVIHGTEDGLKPANNHHWHGMAGYVDTDGNGSVDITLGNPKILHEAGDNLGDALAVADVDGDGYDDLIVGASNEDLGSETDAGLISIWRGSTDSLTLLYEHYIYQDSVFFYDSNGIAYDLVILPGAELENGESFGEQISIGDINNDGYADVITGTPGESFDAFGGNVGMVSVFFGGERGTADGGVQRFSTAETAGNDGESLGDLQGDAGGAFYLGAAVAALDMNKDGYDELVIGTGRYQMAPSNDQIGSVHVLLGSTDGALVEGHQFWTLDGGYKQVNGSSEYVGDLWGDADDEARFGGGLSK